MINIYKYIFFEIRKLPVRLLYYVFKFQRWHIYGSTKPEYSRIVSNLANSIGENLSVVEIGCGLGNIISKVKSPRKIGFDLDNNVIRAAKFIQKFKFHRFKVVFKHGSFTEAILSSPDVLIAVNWIHNIPTEVLFSKLKYFTDQGTIVIIDGVENYKFYHSKKLLSLSFLVQEISVVGEEKRHIFLIKSK
jgi:SAM-dependent methyltransferase